MTKHECDDYDLDVVSLTCSCGVSVFADSLEVCVDLFARHASRTDTPERMQCPLCGFWCYHHICVGLS
jgi:hypothetical protein